MVNRIYWRPPGAVRKIMAWAKHKRRDPMAGFRWPCRGQPRSIPKCARARGQARNCQAMNMTMTAATMLTAFMAVVIQASWMVELSSP